MQLDIKPVSVERVRPLRHRVLRPGQPWSSTLWPRDLDPDTVHFAGFLGTEIVVIGTVFPEPYDEWSDAVRLRGMATAPEHRRKGYGFQLLDAMVRHAREYLGASLLWCNAREAAFPFYERYGFTLVGKPFDVPGIGIHRVGLLRL
ncbi:MAG: GNAT family N-acetyltransferase [Candidatus Neomarinimicrobiota bacterium]|nr:MAG: GNAT family N-acetyltransferase [Candidatus Neomarinimicrobiota bacterium]